MHSILGVTTSYLLIDMALALVALTVGFFAAIWYLRNVSGLLPKDESSPEAIREKESVANDTERANMAAMQLHDLAKNVATDVGTHNSMITGISESLNDVKDGAEDLDATVLEAVSQIMSANEKLQHRLADAELKIQTQAEELSTQQSEARTDALTKLPNRRAFDDALKLSSEAFTDQKRPFSLLIFDVDHFKKFNDAHGHQAGDEVLRKVGETVLGTVKNTDIPCRYGGEEFALVMPGTKIEQARIASERVRKAIEILDVDFEGQKLKVTASIGVAEIVESENSVSLIRRADDAVYAAKNAGRNCSYWHDSDQCRSLEDTTMPGPASTASDKALEVDSDETNDRPVLLKDLPDQAVFTGELHRRINESHRFGVSLSVMYLSVKDYTRHKQEYGDAVGKLLLDTVTQFIRSKLREMDLLGRLGDGDYIVMLPGSSEREAILVGNRVQAAITNCAIPLGSNLLRLELALGVTEVQPEDEAPTMLARAKAAADQPSEENVEVG